MNSLLGNCSETSARAGFCVDGLSLGKLTTYIGMFSNHMPGSMPRLLVLGFMLESQLLSLGMLVCDLAGMVPKGRRGRS
jgi:hypothetical protein